MSNRNQFFFSLQFSNIFRHLEQHNLLDTLPLDRWYGTCFSGVLTKLSLIRIWDKICGGSRKIVVFVFIVLFSTIWRTTKLANTYNLSDVLKIISSVSVQCTLYYDTYETKAFDSDGFLQFLSILSYTLFSFQIKDNQETAELIVNKSIELWQQNKEHTEFRVLRKSN